MDYIIIGISKPRATFVNKRNGCDYLDPEVTSVSTRSLEHRPTVYTHNRLLFLETAPN